MPTTNEHIVEVLCAMWFDENQNAWDSTFFGKYHERIEGLGYTLKEEQRQVEFNIDMNPAKPNSEMKEGKARMIFRNPTEQTAIILSENYISFHKLRPYSNWQDLLTNVVEPGLEQYKQIGLGNGLKEVQCLYLNQHTLEKNQKITSVFGFWPSIEEGFETNILFQTKYDMQDGVTVQLKLNGGANSTGERNLSFECSTFAKAITSSDYRVLADKAHSYANHVYRNLMGEK